MGKTNEANMTTTTDTREGGNCTTQYDSRATATGYITSPPFTPCLFGVDTRDEGEHCVFDQGFYGSNGWCYTSEDGSSWGSCGPDCPLYGQEKILGKKLDTLRDMIRSDDSGTDDSNANAPVLPLA